MSYTPENDKRTTGVKRVGRPRSGRVPQAVPTRRVKGRGGVGSRAKVHYDPVTGRKLDS